MPGQPIGFCAGVPAPVGLMLPLALPIGYVFGANTKRPSAFEPTAKCCSIAASFAVAAAPTSPALTSGPYTSDVPAPYSSPKPFIGCFEYSYDSTAVENPARSIHGPAETGDVSK